MTAAAFAKGLLALEGELTPILVQMVKSANTNGLLDNENEGSSKYQNMYVFLEYLSLNLKVQQFDFVKRNQDWIIRLSI